MHYQRLIGIDIIRLVSFTAIVIFHSSLFYFHLPSNPFLEDSLIIWGLDTFARSIAFSGFTIVLVSSFLVSFAKPSGTNWLGLFIALIIGELVLSFFTNSPLWLAWDVYSVYLFGMMTFFGFSAIPRFWGALGFSLLWIPFWSFTELRPYLSAELQTVLGIWPCESQGIAEWPLLPWVGLVWFGSWLGYETRRLRESQSKHVHHIGRLELITWIAILTVASSQRGGYFNIRLGGLFSCDAYRQAPQVFWSHMAGVLFLLRLSFDQRVQNFLMKSKPLSSLGELAILKNFFFAYVLGYIYLALVINGLFWIESIWPDSYHAYEIAICEFFGLTFILQVELLARLGLKCLNSIQCSGIYRAIFNRRDCELEA